MANLKSSKKDVRRIARRTERNRTAKSRLKTLRKRIGATEGDAAVTVRNEFTSALDKAVKTNLIHANKANRLKSRMARAAKAATAAE